MRPLTALATIGLLALAGPGTIAGGPPCQPGCLPPPCATPGQLPPSTAAPGTAPGATPGMTSDQNAQPPSTDSFAQAPPAGGEAAAMAQSNMIGDLGVYGTVLNFVTSTSTITTAPA